VKACYGDHVQVTHERHVAVVTIDRAPHNFVSVEFMQNLADALDDADRDGMVRALVLQAEGKSFCAGADFAAQSDSVTTDPTGMPALYAEAIRIYSTQKPIVAAIQGPAVGAGLGLALAADFRIASPDARFVANFVKLAFHPGFGITLALPRLIGEQKAALMLLTGRRIKAETALAWGLADDLVSAEALRGAALALAAEIAESGPLAIMATRKTLRGDLAAQIRARTVLEYQQQEWLKTTQDFKEGIRAVQERRPGNFRGR